MAPRARRGIVLYTLCRAEAGGWTAGAGAERGRWSCAGRVRCPTPGGPILNNDADSSPGSRSSWASASVRCSPGCWRAPRARGGWRRPRRPGGAARRGGGAPRRVGGTGRRTCRTGSAHASRKSQRLQARASDLAAEKARLEGDLAAAVDRNALLKTAEETLREAFRALASEALQQNSESMLRLARATLGEMQTRAVADLDKRQQSITEVVKPLVETLHQVDAKLGQVEMDRATTTAKLDEQIRTLGAGPDRAERPDRRSREGAAPAARARPLGRAAAEARRRARGHARSLRLLRAADRDVQPTGASGPTWS